MHVSRLNYVLLLIAKNALEYFSSFAYFSDILSVMILKTGLVQYYSSYEIIFRWLAEKKKKHNARAAYVRECARTNHQITFTSL